MRKIGFDNEYYLKIQYKNIVEAIEKYDNKLYMEFGGKLFDDFHAARILPGFNPNTKVDLLKKLKDKVEIVFVIAAPAIERNKIRADFGISYGMEILRLADEMRKSGLYIGAIVVTQYDSQPAADAYIHRLKAQGEKVYIHRFTKGYPSNIDMIVSEEGYGANPYIETTRPLVVITSPGPANGKLGTCLSQLYHEYKKGIKAGYCKLETFPVWNLPLSHPVNLAYQAATADIKDTNLVDSSHIDSEGIMSINYNRDVEVFPIVRKILTKIMGDENIYKSPTDMGISSVGLAIKDMDIVTQSAHDEIIRRFYKAECEFKQGNSTYAAVKRIGLYMQALGINPYSKVNIRSALEKSKSYGLPVVSIMLDDGMIITGRQTEIMSPSATAVLNAIKVLAKIPDNTILIPPEILDPIFKLRKEILGSKRLLDLSEVLTALSISATTNIKAVQAISKLSELKNTEAHSTIMLSKEDEDMFRKLGVWLTCEPV